MEKPTTVNVFFSLLIDTQARDLHYVICKHTTTSRTLFPKVL